jgi:hypothetical protein
MSVRSRYTTKKNISLGAGCHYLTERLLSPGFRIRKAFALTKLSQKVSRSGARACGIRQPSQGGSWNKATELNVSSDPGYSPFGYVQEIHKMLIRFPHRLSWIGLPFPHLYHVSGRHHHVVDMLTADHSSWMYLALAYRLAPVGFKQHTACFLGSKPHAVIRVFPSVVPTCTSHSR